MKSTPPSNSSQQKLVQTKLNFSSTPSSAPTTPTNSSSATKKVPPIIISTPKGSSTPKASISKPSPASSTSLSATKIVIKSPSKPSPVAAATSSSSKLDSEKTEELRGNVRKTLKEGLLQRTKEWTSNGPKLTEDEINKFCDEVEKELFELFNHDVGNKYKSKYRSLLYNMKDKKNLTLFKKISEKSIQPYRLVRLEPHEMASQELAKWRENESKHSLEIIKKSELENLAASKSYVVKTHKGEEVLESKENDRVELDPEKVAVEDVVSALNKSSTPQSKLSKSSKKEKHSRSRSRDRKHKRNKHEHRHKSHKSSHNKSEPKSSTDTSMDKKITSTENDILIDKILEASQAILNSGRIDVEKLEREAAAKIKIQATSDDELPSSTVTIPTPPERASPSSSSTPDIPCWSGSINIIDVATFDIEAHSFSGDVDSIVNHFPLELEVVGRIPPETAYDYLAQNRKTSHRDIAVVQFTSKDEENYLTLFTYYEERKRLGVVKVKSPVIKDFYIVPLAAEKKLPSVLLPINGPGFLDGEQRTDVLLGVIVMDKSAIKTTSSSSRKVSFFLTLNFFRFQNCPKSQIL